MQEHEWRHLGVHSRRRTSTLPVIPRSNPLPSPPAPAAASSGSIRRAANWLWSSRHCRSLSLSVRSISMPVPPLLLLEDSAAIRLGSRWLGANGFSITCELWICSWCLRSLPLLLSEDVRGADGESRAGEPSAMDTSSTCRHALNCCGVHRTLSYAATM